MNSELSAAARWVEAGVFEHFGIDVTVDHAGRYELRRQLGRGNYGRVWLAHDPKLERDLAIKLPRQTGDADAQLEEARALARVPRHPNLVEIYDVGSERGQVWIAMALIEGVTLREWLNRPHSRRERLRVIRGLASALVALHAAGLVHRDVKPENVMVTPDGEAVLTDLGLSREAISEERERAGTSGYIAPEVVDGMPTSPLSDQWAFAITALEVFDPVLLSPYSMALARACRERPRSRWPDMETLAKKLRWRAAPLVVGSMVAGAGLFALASTAPTTNATRLPKLPDEVAFLRAFDAARAGRPEQAFVEWQSYERQNTPWAPYMSEHLARLLLEEQRPIEAAWVAVNSAAGFEDQGQWTEAAKARGLAATAFEEAGGQIEAERQRACAARNSEGERC